MTPRKVRKIKNYCASDNPTTQREMAKRVGASKTSVSRLIHGRLEQKKFKKAKVHHLTEAAIAKRKERALPFYDLIKNGQYEYILTTDEAWLPHKKNNGQREFFYDAKLAKNRREDAPVAVQSPAWPQKRMFAAGFSWRGPTRLYIVDGDAKVTGAYFLEHVLIPMMTVDVPNLYGPDADKVILHMDSAPSHVFKLVYKWLDDNGYKYFHKDQWLANSPEVSPMDFFANGHLLSALQKRKFRSMDGMLEAAEEEWEKIPLEMFRNALKTWPDRVLAIHKASGRQTTKYWCEKVKNEFLINFRNRYNLKWPTCILIIFWKINLH